MKQVRLFLHSVYSLQYFKIERQAKSQGRLSFSGSASVGRSFDFCLFLHEHILGLGFGFDQVYVPIEFVDKAFGDFDLFSEPGNALCSGCF